MQTDGRMISKLFFSLLPIQILLLAISSINSIIDGIMASNFIGPEAMAVTGLFMPAVKVAETFNVVLLGGSQILCGQFLGKNQIERTRNVFSLDMILVFGLSAVLTLACLLAPGRCAGLLRAEGSAADGLVKYLLGMALGWLPQLLCAQLTAFLQLEQQQKRTYVGMAAMMITNVALDYLFICVLGWGMFGLGLATTVSCWVFAVILGMYYFSGKAVIRFRREGIQWSDLGQILKIGIPGALVTFCLALRGIILNSLLVRYSGNDGLAALASLNTLGSLLYAVTGGLAAATRLLVSVFIGEEDRASLVITMRTALLRGVMLVCGTAAVLFLAAGPVAGIFFRDPASRVFVLTKMLFRIYPFCMPLSAICVIFINYYQSSSRMGIVHILSVMDGIAGTVLSALVLAPIMGAPGVWAAHVLNGVYTTIAIVIFSAVVNDRFPTSLEDLLALPGNFGVPEDRRLDISVSSTSDVVNTSRLVMEFCERNGIPAKRSYYAGLCLEEMAANIVEHGFSDGKKHSVDVRVVQKEEELVLRIKDDCRPFDPKEKLELIDPEDVTHNIGLRMVQRLARQMSYSHILGLNVLTIVL